jgi:hypothetical protein
MFKTFTFTILFILSFHASNVIAQETSNRVAAQSDWSVFVGDDPKECWAVSAPKQTSNTRGGVTVSVKRGVIQLFAIYRPNDGVKGQIAFTGGYPFAEGRNISMKIDGVTYDLPTDGEWAWPPSADDDKKIIAAMKSGSKAILTAQSMRGTVTKDTFSLLGFTAALKEANKHCSS